MSEPGGSATINGVLYQVLGTIGHACAARLQAASIENDDIKSIQLTIEPAGGGGDVQIATNESRIVEQWKAKSTGGTWSLAKVIEEVFPDLYKAVPADPTTDRSEYRFVSEGKIGNWAEAYALFQSKEFRDISGGISTSLDDSDKRHKIGSKQVSDRGLFTHIVDELGKAELDAGAPRATVEKRVWHLLSRFSFPDVLSAARLIAQINGILRDHVDDFADVDGKRRELCGLLLEIASQGDVVISGEQLLVRAGIPLHTFRAWDRLLSRMESRLNEQLSKLQYDQSLDVRPHLLGEEVVTAVSGEGGQGKTWHLARYASEIARRGWLPVWVPSTRNNRDATEYAADEIWHYGLERDSTLSLRRIAEHWRYSRPEASPPWAVVCIDDVNSLDEAQYLCGLDWEKWGLRCVFTTNAEIGRAIEEAGLAAHLPLSDFGTSELHRYLELRGKTWHSIAPDVEQLIRRPILASIYASAVESETWRPENEYEVIEAFWKALKDPLDKGTLRLLAYSLREDGAQYPWPAEHAIERQIARETVQRLIDAGWMKDLGEGLLALWHNRLLAWAFAEALAARFQAKQLSLDELGKTIADCSSGALTAGSVNLGYCPMDVLWLVFGSQSSGSDTLWQLIEFLERSGGYGHRDDVLYEDLLGSLGHRAIIHLVNRTRNSGQEEGNRIPLLAASSLQRIGLNHREQVAAIARQCMKATLHAELELGLRLTATFPDGADLDAVWAFYREQMISDQTISKKYEELKLGQRAFRAALSLQPSWLNAKIKEYEDDAPSIAELAYSLANLHRNDASAVWAKNKETLFRAIPGNKRRSLIGCIVRFRDEDEIFRLRDWVDSSEEFVGPTALQALALFDAAEACSLLLRVHRKNLFFDIGAIGLRIFALAPKEANVAIRKGLSGDSDDSLSFGLMGKAHGDRLDQETVENLIGVLDEGLIAFEGMEKSGANPGLWRRLEIIENLHGAAVLRALRAKQGSAFEARLAAFACSRADNSTGWVDHEFEMAKTILKRIAGDGYTELTNALLAASSRHSRMTGCEEVIVRPNEESFHLLREAAMSDTLWGGGSEPFPVVQQRAIDSLATLGRNRDLIDAVMKWGEKISPHVSELRSGKPPMEDEDFRTAKELLSRPKHPQYANAILALGQTGRVDLVKDVEAVFIEADTDSDVAFKSLLALEDLSDDFSNLVDRLVSQYRSGHHKFAVLKAVLKEPEKIPEEVFWEMLPDTGPYDDIDERLLSYLARNPKTRDQAKERIRTYQAEKGGRRLFSFLDTASVLDPEHPADREALWERSRWPRGAVWTTGGKAAAILRLSLTEADAAYQTAAETLWSDDDDRLDMPDVMLRLNAAKATEDLCLALQKVRDKKMCRALGVSFRRHGKEKEVVETLRASLVDGSPGTRRSAAMVAGYLTETCFGPVISELLLKEGNWAVCTELLLALRMMQRESEAARLVNILPQLRSAEVWGTIDCICELADPEIAVLQSDPLRLVDYLNGQTFALTRYTTKLLDKRLKEVQKEFDSLHNKWDRDDF